MHIYPFLYCKIGSLLLRAKFRLHEEKRRENLGVLLLEKMKTKTTVCVYLLIISLPSSCP